MTNAKTLPHPSDLQAGQALLCIESYSENWDVFHCIMHTAAPCEGQPFDLPAMLLPMLVHEFGEPSEFVGKTFLIERGATKAQYTKLQSVIITVAEDFQNVVNGGWADRSAELVYNAANEANRVAAQL